MEFRKMVTISLYARQQNACVLVWEERGWETGLLIRRNRTHRVGMECRRILKVGQEAAEEGEGGRGRKNGS